MNRNFHYANLDAEIQTPWLHCYPYPVHTYLAKRLRVQSVHQTEHTHESLETQTSLSRHTVRATREPSLQDFGKECRVGDSSSRLERVPRKSFVDGNNCRPPACPSSVRTSRSPCAPGKESSSLPRRPQYIAFWSW